jgi:integrase
MSPTHALAIRDYFTQAEADALSLGVIVTDRMHVFCRPDFSPMLPNTVSHQFLKIATNAGLGRIGLHTLRHTHATLMLSAGVHPKIVQERLGHSSISVTLDTYSHLLPGIQQAAALGFDASLRGQQPSMPAREPLAVG